MRHALSVFALLAVGALCARADDKDNPVAEAKKAIEHQLKLVKDGDVEKLKGCFTKRLQEKITKESVTEAQKNTGKVTIDDLVKDVTVAEQGGTKRAKITMKNGRTLTTLVLTDGKWLADTIWFK
jgi:ribosome-associated protein YbcJ (S4-like RNA binding protein)